MIGIRTSGRMGNNMFQFSFGYTASKILKTRYFLDKMQHLRYFELYNNIIVRNTLNKLYASKLFLQGRFNYFDWEDSWKSPDFFFQKLSNNALYKGFFQSEKYFKDHIPEIKSLFQIRPKYKTEFISKYGKLFNENKIIAIHVRRTDYVNSYVESLAGSYLLPISYYQTAINQIHDLNDSIVIVLSDDIEFAQRVFGNRNNFMFENNSEIVDFQVLLNSEIMIISNSTFSWWAAYLNENNNKHIFAPKYWMGFRVQKEYPSGIMNDSWNWIEV